MVAETVDLKEASKIEIISLMDNNVDFLSSNTRKEVQSLRHWTKEIWTGMGSSAYRVAICRAWF